MRCSFQLFKKLYYDFFTCFPALTLYCKLSGYFMLQSLKHETTRHMLTGQPFVAHFVKYFLIIWSKKKRPNRYYFSINSNNNRYLLFPNRNRTRCGMNDKRQTYCSYIDSLQTYNMQYMHTAFLSTTCSYIFYFLQDL